MRNILAAINFLTVLGRFSDDSFGPERVGRGALYFPFVGLLLGASLAIINRFFEPYLESEILGVALITILILFTGAIHLEQTWRIFTATAKADAARQTGAEIHLYGFLVVMLIVLFKIRSVEVIGELRKVALILTPVLARWALVIFLYGSNASMEDLTQRISKNIRAWYLLFTSVGTLAITVFLMGNKGLWIALAVSLIALVLRTYLGRSSRALALSHCGALIELTETLSLILFATL